MAGGILCLTERSNQRPCGARLDKSRLGQGARPDRRLGSLAGGRYACGGKGCGLDEDATYTLLDLFICLPEIPAQARIAAVCILVCIADYRLYRKEEDMLLPTDLLPSALGLKWGMSVTECLALLQATPTYKDPSHILVPMQIAGSLREVEMFFEDQDNSDIYHWYDAHGNRHDWARGTMWDREGNV